MTEPPRRPTALRPWIIVAALLPLVALGAWLGGVFDDPPAAPIDDPNVRELALGVAPPPPDRDASATAPRARPLVIFLGDSRYLRALRAFGQNMGPRRPQSVEGAHGFDMLSYFTRAGATIVDLDRYLEDILAWKPDAIVVQPELMVEESSIRGMLPAIANEKGRIDWHERLRMWAKKVELPVGGHALEAARRFAARATAQGARILAAQIPPSAEVAAIVPADYYATIRALVCPVLARCEADFLTFAPSYPDRYFRDPLHFNSEGREMFYPLLVAAVGRALAVPR